MRRGGGQTAGYARRDVDVAGVRCGIERGVPQMVSGSRWWLSLDWPSVAPKRGACVCVDEWRRKTAKRGDEDVFARWKQRRVGSAGAAGRRMVRMIFSGAVTRDAGNGSSK